MTISESLKFAAAKLNAGCIDIPHLEAEILLSKTLKKSREFILTHGERKLAKFQIANYKLLIKKRLKRIPVAYLTNEKEFYGLKFKVNKSVLIPRPETELIVEEALTLATHCSQLATRNSQPATRNPQLATRNSLLVAHNPQPVTLIDVGTGSGCIIIALAKQLLTRHKIQNIKYKLFGIDISKKALIVAKQNAKIHNVNKKIKFIIGNLLEPIINNPKYKIQNTKYIILANLPYLTQTQIKNSPTIKHEPNLALSGGKNGLRLYKKLLEQINYLIQKYKIHDSLFILCEFDPRQTGKIKQLIKRELPGANCQIKKDLFGLNRLVIIKIPSV
ncbi:peptide chain release factor N(5)-glutamine methyltransferase [Patescibacteria group bacterium]|nr:peptide chain release factor N(5)-glutamine methyltransferase [Patescibacteria group bacterium]